MTETQPVGMLIDPSTERSHALTDDELETLQNVLEIVRKRQLGRQFNTLTLHYHYEALCALIMAHCDNDNASETLRLLISYFQDSAPSGLRDGVLADHGPIFEPLADGEAEFLKNALVTYRGNTWFSDWIAMQVDNFANQTMNEDRYRTPLEMAGLLTLEVAKWEERMNAARNIASVRPDLIFPKATATPETNTDAPVTEAAPEAPAAPAKTHRTRKAAKGKKAA